MNEFSLEEITAYIESKFMQNRCKTCTIQSETKQTITIKFKDYSKRGIAAWIEPLSFLQQLKKKEEVKQ